MHKAKTHLSQLVDKAVEGEPNLANLMSNSFLLINQIESLEGS
ncbi:protein of unknown function [Xenorhabdus doucetiae]|uniref:Uncharacterized protein n=1 Tax=Xenorhabdus doucetiae TaxID=351671 RepID=A0A068QXF5_9GAMM|nr:protein of unknown function [Xenorhabdus doucetiae]